MIAEKGDDMGATRFKNGNINVRFDRSDLEDIRAGHVSGLEVLLVSLDAVDTYAVGDEYCLGNSAMGRMFYSAYSGKVFHFNMDDLGKLRDGKTVKLYASEPDADEMELVEGWF